MNLTVKDIVSRVNLKQKEYDSLMPPEVVALSIAENEGIDLGDLKSQISMRKKLKL